MLQLNLVITGLLANQCMPTLLKAKPSSLIAVKLMDIPKRESFHEMFVRIVGSYDCLCYPLKEWNERLYYIVYQEKLLQDCLHMEDNKRFLINCGYQYPEYNINLSLLKQLKCRCDNYYCKRAEFPHEIGIILGYPLADVEGFIKNKGKNYLLCGMWKVYQDVERAQRLFTLYRQMKEDARRLLQEEMLCNDIYREVLTDLYK
jgi:hypothetical protein